MLMMIAQRAGGVMHDPEDALKELEALEALDEDHDDLGKYKSCC